MNLDKSATRSGLVGRYLTALDLKKTKTICRGSLALQPIRKHYESHVSKRFFQHGAIFLLDESVPSFHAASADKNTASARPADGPTNFNPI